VTNGSGGYEAKTTSILWVSPEVVHKSAKSILMPAPVTGQNDATQHLQIARRSAVEC